MAPPVGGHQYCCLHNLVHINVWPRLGLTVLSMTIEVSCGGPARDPRLLVLKIKLTDQRENKNVILDKAGIGFGMKYIKINHTGKVYYNYIFGR